jgi:putative DNA primase/helicase
MFPDPKERRCAMIIISSALIGTNIWECFYFWVGSGSNGKGILSQLLDSVLGDYYGTLDIDYFNSKDNIRSGAANSALAACKNKRWVNISEIESSIRLKDNRVKQLSGRDKVQARNLYGNSFEYIAKFKMCFQTNERPAIDGADDAMKRRLRYITFRTKFVDTPVLPHERQIDRELKDRILMDDKYKHAFFHILLKYYNKLVEEDDMKLIFPDSFQTDMNNYLQENDPVSSFIDCCLIKTGSREDRIQSSVLYEAFQKHAENNFVTVSKFKNILEKKGVMLQKRKNGNYYCGVIFKAVKKNVTKPVDELEIGI